jgi:hypothetical protein
VSEETDMSDDSTTPYVVSKGDYLLAIALAFGVEPDAIWSHAKNGDLVKTRAPDVLAPGDVLYVPKPPAPTLRVSRGVGNAFTAKVPKVALRLAFAGDDGPFANEPYELHGLGDVVKGTTDGAGLVTADVPVRARSVSIVFPKRHLEHAVDVGALDPATTPAGLRARLAHLGLADASRPLDPADVRAFQTANGLPATGRPDADTAALAERLHGR